MLLASNEPTTFFQLIRDLERRVFAVALRNCDANHYNKYKLVLFTHNKNYVNIGLNRPRYTVNQLKSGPFVTGNVFVRGIIKKVTADLKQSMKLGFITIPNFEFGLNKDPIRTFKTIRQT